MGRVNNRSKILAAVTVLIEREGIAGVTLEAVAAEAGLTKGGLQYHFTSKQELMEAVEDETWERADEAALKALGKPYEDATPDELLEALVRSSAASEVRKADLHLVLNGSVSEHAIAKRDAFIKRWTGEEVRELSTWKWAALLASDGLWVHDALDSGVFGPGREELLNVLVEMIRR